MTKKNLIIVIVLLLIIDLVAAAWYMVQRNEALGKQKDIFEQFESKSAEPADVDDVDEADAPTALEKPDEFETSKRASRYYSATAPANNGDASSYYTSTKHVKVVWPKSVNGNDNPVALTNELIKVAFGNNQTSFLAARYNYLRTPQFNKPIGDYRELTEVPNVYPIYGNVTQVLVYPYMTSNQILVMEVDKHEYNGATTNEKRSFVNYDRVRQRVLLASDILDQSKINQVLEIINDKIDDLNKTCDEANRLSHALNVPVELCCSKQGIIFEFQNGTLCKGRYGLTIAYDDLKNCFSDQFMKIVKGNGNCSLYNDKPTPEPLHYDAAKARASVRAEAQKNNGF